MKINGNIILASSSPRRYELLRRIGLNPQIVKPIISESLIPGEVPGACTLRLCKEKVKAVIRIQDKRLKDSWIIGADTVVVLEGKLLNKPSNQNDAEEMLGSLSAKTHKVITSFCVADSTGKIFETETVESYVKFRKISQAEIKWYIATGEPMDKAGAYGIQGLGAIFVESIEGSYNNVVGLPVSRLVETLKNIGAISF